LAAAVAAAAGLLLFVVARALGSELILRAWLIGWLFWLGVALGSLGLLMLYHLTGGIWGYALRRPLEAAALTLPFLAVLFLPLLYGVHDLYPWSNRAAQSTEVNRLYLNVPFFVVRAVICFAAWTVMALLFARWSGEQDRADPARGALLALRMQRLAGPGLVLYVVTATFAGFDWLMSLEPGWWSSVTGMIVVVGQALSALALMVILAAHLESDGRLGDVAPPSTFLDLGNLMLMLVMLWAYLAFSQFLILWSGNTTDDITWYMPRYRTSWVVVSAALLIFYFFVPFALLLFRGAKRRAAILQALSAGLLLMRWVELVWTVEPSFDRHGVVFRWPDAVLCALLGAIWIGAFRVLLHRAPLLARHDPRLRAAVSHA
jgi:hypothetical protein